MKARERVVSPARSVTKKSAPLSLGGVWGKELSLGGEAVPNPSSLALLSLQESATDEVKLSIERENLTRGREDSSLVSYQSWALITIDEGQPLEVERGVGAPPKQVSWAPLDPLESSSQIGLQLKIEGVLSANTTRLDDRGLSGPFVAYSSILWVTAKSDQTVLSTDQKRSSDALWRLRLGDPKRGRLSG